MLAHRLPPIVLASGSPRRQQLLAALDLPFTVETRPTNEDWPEELAITDIPVYLAEKKSQAFSNEELDNRLLITADTVVILHNQVLNKPENAQDARQMLRLLSNRMHQVITGVCLRTGGRIHTFADETKVYFRKLTDAEIDFYIMQYKPFDKAGAYGAQEWMGMTAIDKIEGSYFNVMGLPTHRLYQELLAFTS